MFIAFRCVLLVITSLLHTTTIQLSRPRKTGTAAGYLVARPVILSKYQARAIPLVVLQMTQETIKEMPMLP